MTNSNLEQDIKPPAPKKDSVAPVPTVVEGVDQTNDQKETQITVIADPVPNYRLTPSIPEVAINTQKEPLLSFKSILVPILADLDKSHPTNYVSLFARSI